MGFMDKRRFDRAWDGATVQVMSRLRQADPRNPVGDVIRDKPMMVGMGTAQLAFERFGMSLEDSVSYGQSLMLWAAVREAQMSQLASDMQGLEALDATADAELKARMDSLERTYGRGKTESLYSVVGNLVAYAQNYESQRGVQT